MCDGMVACQTSAPVPRCASLRLATPLVLLLAVFSRGHASGCPRPSGVPHGWVNLTETNRGFFPVGTLLQYSCDPGYMVDGPAVISCTPSGRWSYEPPLCIRTDVCRPPAEPENGGYTCHPSPCHRLSEGTVVEYFCDDGYTLKGQYKYRTCQNGDWDSDLQINCRPVQDDLVQGCPRPSGVQHGWVNLTETNRGFFPVGTVLLYSCDSGYMVDGPAVISCTPSGRWSYEPPLCIRTNVCQPPNEPENGGYTCHPSPCHRLTEGTVIEYFCDEGYALKGEYKYRTCQNGEWDTTMQISCHFSQEKDEHSPLAMPALSIVASTASSVALILLLVVLFVLVQPKLKSFHHSRREQGVSGQPTSIMVEGMQVTLPSYEEAVYGSGGACAAPAQESRVQIVLSEGPQAEGGRPQTDYSLPSTSAAAAAASLSSSSSSSSSSRHSETVLVHQVPCCSSSSSSSSPSSWAAEQPGASASAFLPHNSESSDQHSLLSLTSTEDFADDIPLLKEA
ncbi:sushi domain-containing protein 6 isoform X1 [Denticeps clupeoides]|uniref:Sushi domain-containing protein n=1 Tax=Denticeps clupeoides TaxID=299321 RepID=A0AAY4BUK4_9TELE|nr:sushi domain-containing protein 6 isoform X1 [Denticeps clupeoides]XP_028858815.1 sushi domain-containing protein 6 isoform X1 [Denticeps clupeoides]XP_028858816.1 sushi domain-containing protein 6 isoform X1 [Denticeps clupeoides]